MKGVKEPMTSSTTSKTRVSPVTVRTFVQEDPTARTAQIEVDVTNGIPAFSIVGLSDVAVREARERVRAGLINTGFEFPAKRIVANLAPTWLRRTGFGLDLPLAVGVLVASRQFSWERLPRVAFAGALGLDGTLRAIPAVAAMTAAAREEGAEVMVVPAANGAEAATVEGIEVVPLESLSQLPALAASEWTPERPEPIQTARACPDCLRRARLVASLAPYIERVVGGASALHIQDLLQLRNQDLAEAVAPLVASQLLERTAAISERQLELDLRDAGCWATCQHDALYPAGLRHCPNGPHALFGRGDPALLPSVRLDRTVAIVGSRRATAYGLEVAQRLGRELAADGITVVSGLAFGIDTAAHRGALEGGRTVAVLGGGADLPYPKSNASLWRQIAASGLVLSELPPGASPRRWTFPARNRIVAALAGMTVVVEAAEASGSLITSDRAARLGRKLGAVPGPVTSRTSGGTNRLLAGGTTVIRNGQDVLDAMGIDDAAGSPHCPHCGASEDALIENGCILECASCGTESTRKEAEGG